MIQEDVKITADIVKKVVLEGIPKGTRIICRAALPQGFPYKPSTMKQYDNLGVGVPNRFSIGKKCFYRVDDLIDWLCQRIT
jgi:hypothetical protein